jgi:RNA polymerase sigma factor (sigma-70 family)
VTVDDHQLLAERFEDHRGHLRAVAYRMLGSLSEAEDAVQETWINASRADVGGVENLGGWLTRIVSRVCLDALRARRSRPQPADEDADDMPMPLEGPTDPEREALLADAVGMALQVVMDTLSPAERVAFILHDLFAVPFDQVAPVVGRSPTAARKLASRARQRVQEARPDTTELAGQRAVVEAFLAASRGGDLDALLAVLAPDVVITADRGSSHPPVVTRGADEVARRAHVFARHAPAAVLASIEGRPGLVVTPDRGPRVVLDLRVVDGRIARIDVLVDPELVDRLRFVALPAPSPT